MTDHDPDPTAPLSAPPDGAFPSAPDADDPGAADAGAAHDVDGDALESDAPPPRPRASRRVAREHICGIRFRRAGKVYWFDASACPDVAAGAQVIVDTVRGREIGRVVIAPGQVADANVGELTAVLRAATDADLASQAELRLREPAALSEARSQIRRENLPMNAVLAEYSYDGSRLTVYFTSDEMRVDFRNLVRDLARSLKTRVTLRQIGPRDQAKLVGGIDRCGRELCCTSWMPEFQPISIRMAKNQGLPLNPSEISGVCGKLLCCLAFEDDQYRDMRRGLPKVGAKLTSAVGKGKVIDVNVITRKITIVWETGSRVEVDAEAFAEQQDRLMKAFGAGGEVPPEFLPPEARPAVTPESGPRRVYMQRDAEGGSADAWEDEEVDRPRPAPSRVAPATGAPSAPRPAEGSRRPERGGGQRERGPAERGPAPRPQTRSQPPRERDGGPRPPGVGDPVRPRRRRRGGRGGGGGGAGGGAAGAGANG